MFHMLKQFFTMLAVLFNAGERGARALDNVAAVAEEASEGYRDIERLKRAKKIQQLKDELNGNTKPQLVATTDQPRSEEQAAL